MPVITSRPEPVQTLSREQLMRTIEPVINVLDLVSTLMFLPDDTQHSVHTAHSMIESTIQCFDFFDYKVMVMPTLVQHDIPYDVVIRVAEAAPFVSFRVTFHVLP